MRSSLLGTFAGLSSSSTSNTTAVPARVTSPPITPSGAAAAAASSTTTTTATAASSHLNGVSHNAGDVHYYGYFIFNYAGKNALWIMREYFDDIIDKDTNESVKMYPSAADEINDDGTNHDATYYHNKMKNSKFIIVIVTKSLFTNPACINDIVFAIDNKIPLIPVVIEEDDFHSKEMEAIVSNLDKYLDQAAIDQVKKNGADIIDVCHKIQASFNAHSLRKLNLKDSKKIRIAQIEVIKDVAAVAKFRASTLSKDEFIAKRNAAEILRVAAVIPPSPPTPAPVAAPVVETPPAPVVTAPPATPAPVVATPAPTPAVAPVVATPAPAPAAAPAPVAATPTPAAPAAATPAPAAAATPAATTAAAAAKPATPAAAATTPAAAAAAVVSPSPPPRKLEKATLFMSSVVLELDNAIKYKHLDNVVICCDFLYDKSGGDISRPEDDTARNTITKNGGVKACINGLKTLSGETCVPAITGLVKVIRNLARNKDNKAVIMADAETIIATLQTNKADPMIQQYGFSALTLLMVVEENKSILMKLHIGTAIVEGMKANMSKADVQKGGCTAIWNLATSAENKVALMKGGAGYVIIEALKNHKAVLDVVKNGTGALLQLSSAKENAPQLKSLHVRDIIQTVMKENTASADIQKYGSGILTNVP